MPVNAPLPAPKAYTGTAMHAVVIAGAELGVYFPFLPVAACECERARVMVRRDDDQGAGVF